MMSDNRPERSIWRRFAPLGCFLGGLLLVDVSAAAEFRGRILANQPVEVESESAGRVSRVLVRPGQFVRAGQPVVELEAARQREELATARRQAVSRQELEAAELDLAIQRHRMGQLQWLWFYGQPAWMMEIEDAEASLRRAEAAVRDARTAMTRRQVRVEVLREELERQTVLAPAKGYVGRVHLRRGDTVQGGGVPLLQLVPIDPLVATFEVPHSYTSQVSPGTQIAVALDQGVLVSGQVTAVTDGSSTTTRQVRVVIGNRLGVYRPDQECSIELTAGPGADARGRGGLGGGAIASSRASR